MKTNRLWAAAFACLVCCGPGWAQKRSEAKTIFQTSEPWKTETDIRADGVMVYGTADKPGVTFEQRIRSWKDRGYKVQFMTGVAWGDYSDYFLGWWDKSREHMKEGQR